MPNPNKNHTYIFALWGLLFVAGIALLKFNPSPQSSSWLERKLQEKKNDTAIKQLNMSMPSADLHQELIKATVDKNYDLPSKELTNYYKLIVDAMPQVAEGHALLGFCYYKQGDFQDAFDQFQIAFQLNPEFFYYSLNLSLMYLKVQHVPEALKLLLVSINTDPRKNLEMVASSKIYRDILSANPEYNPALELQKNYAQAKALIENIQSNAKSISDNDKIHIRVF